MITKNNYVYFLLLLFMFSCGENANRAKKVENSADTTLSLIENINEKLKSDTLNSELYNERARYYLENANLNMALKDINRAIQLNPENSDLFVTLSDIYLVQNKLQQSVEAIDKAISIDKNNYIAFARMARILIISGQYEDAVNYISQGRNINPEEAEFYFLYGYLKVLQGDTTIAVQNLLVASEKNPEYLDPVLLLAGIYENRGNPMTVDFYKRALEIDPENQGAYYSLGFYYQDHERLDEAEAMYNRLIDINSNNKYAYYNLAYIHLVYRKDFVIAADYFTKVVEIDPNYVDALFNLGYSYELQMNPEEARIWYNNALKVQANYENAIIGLNRLDNFSNQ
ncbi:tetratricopeptide repeat protein [Bacteroidota bacterium]